MSTTLPSYREAGAGFPVLCLHASAGGPGQWRALMARLAGSAAPFPGRALANLLAPALPRAELLEFAGVGHTGPVTHPDRVIAAIERFLDRVVGAEVGRAAPLDGRAA
ncbi:MAG TPA: hypothetical protein VFW96_14160 [Thermomicrobiales bacterium]|nr:hypothetical protein [Thermomicrobiales bacterium]